MDDTGVVDVEAEAEAETITGDRDSEDESISQESSVSEDPRGRDRDQCCWTTEESSSEGSEVIDLFRGDREPKSNRSSAERDPLQIHDVEEKDPLSLSDGEMKNPAVADAEIRDKGHDHGEGEGLYESNELELTSRGGNEIPERDPLSLAEDEPIPPVSAEETDPLDFDKEKCTDGSSSPSILIDINHQTNIIPIPIMITSSPKPAATDTDTTPPVPVPITSTSASVQTVQPQQKEIETLEKDMDMDTSQFNDEDIMVPIFTMASPLTDESHPLIVNPTSTSTIPTVAGVGSSSSTTFINTTTTTTATSIASTSGSGSFLAAAPVSPTKNVPPIPGIKDSDGFLTPPPASTLFIRRNRNSTGAASYVVAPGPSSLSPKHSSTSSSSTSQQPQAHESVSKKIKFDPASNKPSTSAVITKQKPIVKPSIPRKGKPESYSLLTSGSSNGATIKMPPRKRGRKPGQIYNLKKSNRERKKRGQDKNPNIDPCTGKRKYIKKRTKGFCIDKRKNKNKKLKLQKYTSASEEFAAISSNLKNKKKKKKKPTLSDKGIWRPMDDLKLIINVIQVKDINLVHKGVNFSCRYSAEQIEKRFKSLMYSTTANLTKCALKAIQNLHPFVKAQIYKEALFSEEEEKILKTISAKCNPTTDMFKRLLSTNIGVFLKGRTEKVLLKHWWNLKNHHLLDDQDIMDYFKSEKFEDFEESINDVELFNEIPDEALLNEILLESQNNLKRIRILEEEEAKWQELVDFALGVSRNEFDETTYAILKGKNVSYLMKSVEICLGRNTEYGKVDADLSEEGPAFNISRRQATIKLRSFGEFIILNEGKNPIIVNGRPILKDQIAKLENESIILVGGLSLIFVINAKVINEMQEHAVNDENKNLCSSSKEELVRMIQENEYQSRNIKMKQEKPQQLASTSSLSSTTGTPSNTQAQDKRKSPTKVLFKGSI